jgi:hypothetical protein
VLSFRSLDPDLSEGTRTEKKEELRMVNHNFGDGEIGFFNLAEEVSSSLFLSFFLHHLLLNSLLVSTVLVSVA